MTRPYCVGLTGGIASGKSLVASLFAQQGAGIIDTDVIARELTQRDGEAMPTIRAAFGEDCVAPDGALDRAAMRAWVFSDAEARSRLEGILHPLIRDRARRLLEQAAGPYAVLVVPLLVETGAYGALIDRIVVVDCDPGRQVERLVGRDGISETLAHAMLAAQASREVRLAVADDIIDNQGDIESLRDKVVRLHRDYVEAARAHSGREE